MVNAITSMFESSLDDLSFKLQAGEHKEADLVVAGFTAREALSTLFEWTIEVVIDPEKTPTIEDTIGRDAEFQIVDSQGKTLRTVHGIVGEVNPLGPSGNQALVALTVVPKLAELQYRTDTRIFQDMPVNEIVEAIFKPLAIQPYWMVLGQPPKRDYRVQKNETDYNFFCRILADAGIHFYFVHDGKGTKVYFASDPKGYINIDGDTKLPFREIAGAVTVDHVASAEQRRALRPAAVMMRDYDFAAPGKDLTVKEEVSGPHDDERAPRREIYIYPGDYIEKPVGTSLAKRRLEEARSDALVFSGKSSCVQLEAGRKFTLEKHPDETFNREWTITRLSASGRRGGILADTGQGSGPGFTVSFLGVPSDINNPRPARIPGPPAHPESAVVVGPAAGSPFVDKYGRVKVQFHWDRQGKKDEHSSCWLRVMTPAAGGGRGIWFPPRVGDEVIVQHIDGDLDRPFVGGAIYNGAEMQPNPLPDQSAKSTIKTLSIPASAKGFNELTFTDTAGSEEIFLHAQKDRRTAVLHNHNETVGANQSVTVGANQSITVGANRSVTVGANETTHIKGKREEHVDTAEEVHIKAGRTHTIATADDSLTVSVGNRTVDVALKDTHHAQTKVETIDQTFELKAGTSIWAHTIGGDAEVKVEAGGVVQINTKTKVVLWTPSGNITLADDKITLSAVAEIELQVEGASLSLKKGGTIELKGGKEIKASVGGSSLTLDPSKAALDGGEVDLNA